MKMYRHTQISDTEWIVCPSQTDKMKGTNRNDKPCDGKKNGNDSQTQKEKKWMRERVSERRKEYILFQ